MRSSFFRPRCGGLLRVFAQSLQLGAAPGNARLTIDPGMDEAGRTLGAQLAAVEEEEPGRLEEGQFATRGLGVQDYGGTLIQAIYDGARGEAAIAPVQGDGRRAL